VVKKTVVIGNLSFIHECNKRYLQGDILVDDNGGFWEVINDDNFVIQAKEIEET